MRFVKYIIVVILSFAVSFCHGEPGGKRHGDVHHRIHVPTKVRTVYRTKIIKVPEIHHYIHEKGKKEVYFDELKEIPHQEQRDHHHPFHQQSLQHDYPNYDYGQDYGSHHNIYRRYGPIKRHKIVPYRPYHKYY